MAYDSRNPKKSSLILTDEAGTPANPPAGSTKLITRSGLLYHRSSAGTETAVLTGAAATQYSGKSADYTVTDTDNIRTVGMTTSSTNRTVTLPTAADNTHRIITVKKVDSGTGTVIVDGEGAETIDGATTVTLTGQYDSVTLQCTGSAWLVIGRGDALYAEGSLGTLSWSGSTPTNINKRYRWHQDGKKVTIWWRIDATANGAQTYVSAGLPAECPTPAEMTNQDTSEWVTVGVGVLAAAQGNALGGTVGVSGLYKTGASAYELYVYGPSVTATHAWGCITYYTA